MASITEKIEYHLDLARLAQIDGKTREYKKQIAEIRRLTKEKEGE